MTSFKAFRNRAHQSRADGDGQAGPPEDRSADGSMNRRRDHRDAMVPANDDDRARAASTATEMGPEHFDILRQIESEGEPLSLAEEVAELADRGDLERAAQALELLNKQSETHI